MIAENPNSVVELEVIHKEFLGKEYNVELICDDKPFIVKIDVRQNVEEGLLKVAIMEDMVHFFDPVSTNRIDKE